MLITRLPLTKTLRKYKTKSACEMSPVNQLVKASFVIKAPRVIKAIILTKISYALTAFSLLLSCSMAQANEIAPDFTLPSKDSGNVRLAEQRGNIVMLNFWASWCGPCREELPKMEALYQEYQDMGFEILAVNVDDEPSKADILLNDIDVSFPVLYDTAGDVSKLYDVSAMPTTVIIDRNGNKRLTHLGYRAGDEIKYEKALKLLMRE